LPPLHTLGSSDVQTLPILAIFLLVGTTFSFMAANLRRERNEAVKEVDIRKQTEVELLKYREHLEETVKDRTLELQEVNLDLNKELSERKKAEETIKQANQQWQETFDAMPDLISIHDRDYNIVMVNKAFSKAFSMTTEQLVGKKCYEVFHETTEPILTCPHRQTIKTGQSHHEEIFEPTRNAYFDVSTAPVVNASGETTQSVHIARDITAQKQAEADLAHLASFPELNPSPIIELNLAGNFTYLNPAIKTLFPDLSVRGTAHPLLAGWRANIDKLLGDKLSYIIEEVEIGDSWYEQTIIYLPASDTYRIYSRDITERKRVEHLKDEFIGLISHELRTPLTIITGSLHSAMSAGVSAEDVSELLQNAAEGADSLANILENMLELSRHQAGRLQLHIERVNINDVVQNMIEKLKRQGVSQRLLVNISGDLPKIEADPIRVERTVYNLLENAAKYSPAASEIRVTGRTEGNFVITEVTDQGKGISPDDQKRLFEPFQQLGTPARTAKGAGLGLVVCKRLVEAQGGWIKVDSEVGRGSTFSFALPIRRT